MKIIITILTILSFNISVDAQSYAIIKDSDGYTNVRKEANSKSAIVGKLYDDAIFSLGYEDNGNTAKTDWIKIYQTRENGSFLEGYIHKSRILPLSSFKSIASTNRGANYIIINNDSIKVKVTATNFIAKKHRLTYHKPAANNEAGYYEKIDGKKMWGTDGELPKKAISSLSVSLKGSDLSIPKSAIENLFEPGFYRPLRAYLGLKNTLYIEMNNSDGAGSYTVIWVIKDGKYQTRFIDNLLP